MSGPWDDDAIVALGGKGIISRVWNELKDAMFASCNFSGKRSDEHI